MQNMHVAFECIFPFFQERGKLAKVSVNSSYLKVCLITTPNTQQIVT